jgi:3-hydroxyisobutyrate dehydrogenase
MASGETVAVLGAGGMMGLPMARNLAHAGISVRGWNRSAEKAEPLRDDGAEVLGTPAEAAEGAGVILTMLVDSDAVIESMDGAAGALQDASDDAVWLQMSTVGEEGTERCIELARNRGVEFVDAPVLGTKAPAEQGKLVVLASGPDQLRDRLQPLFDAVGERTVWVGEAGTGTRLKLATNSWLVAVVEGVAETVALTEGLGLDPAMLLEVFGGTALDVPYLQMKGKAIIERDFEPSFKLKLATKDARLIDEAVRRRGLDLPLISLIHERFTAGVEEHGEEDMIATYLTSAPGNAADRPA